MWDDTALKLKQVELEVRVAVAGVENASTSWDNIRHIVEKSQNEEIEAWDSASFKQYFTDSPAPLARYC